MLATAGIAGGAAGGGNADALATTGAGGVAGGGLAEMPAAADVAGVEAGTTLWGDRDQIRSRLFSRGGFSGPGLEPPDGDDRLGSTAASGCATIPCSGGTALTAECASASGLPTASPSRRAISPALDGRCEASLARHAATVVSHSWGIACSPPAASDRRAAIGGTFTVRI